MGTHTIELSIPNSLVIYLLSVSSQWTDFHGSCVIQIVNKKINSITTSTYYIVQGKCYTCVRGATFSIPWSWGGWASSVPMDVSESWGSWVPCRIDSSLFSVILWQILCIGIRLVSICDTTCCWLSSSSLHYNSCWSWTFNGLFTEGGGGKYRKGLIQCSLKTTGVFSPACNGLCMRLLLLTLV